MSATATVVVPRTRGLYVRVRGYKPPAHEQERAETALKQFCAGVLGLAHSESYLMFEPDGVQGCKGTYIEIDEVSMSHNLDNDDLRKLGIAIAETIRKQLTADCRWFWGIAHYDS